MSPAQQTNIQSLGEGAAPFLVSKGISDELTVWLTKGMSGEESKAISKRFPLQFEDESFTVRPPKLDGYMQRRAKDKNVLKSVNSAEEILIAVQHKVCDIAPPLVDLYARVLTLEGGDQVEAAKDSVRSALRQWARAWLHVTKQRRRAVVDLVEPSFEFLLAGQDSFAAGAEAREKLFTEKFLESMLKEATQDATLAQKDAVARPATRAGRPARQGRGRMVREPAVFQQPYPRPGVAGASQGATRRVRFRGARNAGDSWSRIGQRYEKTLSFVPINVCSPDDHVGARLLKFSKNWERVTDDRWILDAVAGGVKFDFLSQPRQNSAPPQIKMSSEMVAVCDQEVRDLILKKAVREIVDGSEGFVCSLFVIPKKTGGFRPIVNLKPLNKFIKYEHFKMENLQAVRFLLREGDWMVKVDLKDAYLTVPIHPSHQKFVRFQWQGRIFEFTCLAFGLAPAPRIFTKILKVVMAFVRKQGVRLVIYLDDILIISGSREGALADLKLVVELLRVLGFILNVEKSVFEPTQSIEFLGVIVDALKLSFALPPSKVQAVTDLCRTALRRDFISLRDIACIMGNFTWAIPTMPFAQAHYRSMQRFYIDQAQRVDFDLAMKCILSPEAKSDLEWWVANLSLQMGKRFFPKLPDLEIYTDASLTGWGAVCNGVTTNGSWTLSDSRRHINELELIGALFAIQAFVGRSSGIAVRLVLDNATAVAYINHGGGTRSLALTTIAKDLVAWCEKQEIAVEAVHIAGKLNVEADAESRAGPDASDWRLDPEVFRKIFQLWPTNIDLFASPWNAQLETFVSWKPQPGALASNAFTLNWEKWAAFVFPPFSLIFRCLQKIRKEKATVVFVCPVWTGQPWYPLLLELCCDQPRLLRAEHCLLTSPLNDPHPLLRTGGLLLAAWKLSGDVIACRDFRRKWSSFSWKDSAQALSQLTNRRGAIGCVGAWRGVKIPCQLI